MSSETEKRKQAAEEAQRAAGGGECRAGRSSGAWPSVTGRGGGDELCNQLRVVGTEARALGDLAPAGHGPRRDTRPQLTTAGECE